MALPHLVVDRKYNTNFKNRNEADFVSRSRKAFETRTAYEAYVDRQCRYDNFNSSYDKLISDNAFEKSLQSYINLRNKARKDAELVGRRDRLASLFKSEREMYMVELKAMGNPKCDVLYDEIRQKGFFEKLYEDDDVNSRTRRAQPHLVSEYEQELYGIGVDGLTKAKNDLSRKRELREYLMNQQKEKLQNLKDERRERAEEERMNLLAIKSMELQQQLESEQQKQLRKASARALLSDSRSAQKYGAAFEAALDEAVEEEAVKANYKLIARRALEEARRQELNQESRRGQAEQLQAKAKQVCLDVERQVAERRENEEMNRWLAAERQSEDRRRFLEQRTNREAFDEQVQEKYERATAELWRLKLERETDRRAEAAYQAMLQQEAGKLRTTPDYRRKAARFD